MKRLFTFLMLQTLVLALWAQTCRTASCCHSESPSQWTGTWATAVEYTGQVDMPRHSLASTTLRQVVRVSMAGNENLSNCPTTLRLQLSNEFSDAPVEIKCVYIANALDSSDIQAGSARYLTFKGQRAVTIAAGATVWSDELTTFPLKALSRVAITVSYGKNVPTHATSHRGSRTTSYIASGKVGPQQKFSTIEKVDHWYNIAKLEVRSLATAIAVLGNSITDGRGSTTNQQDRWTDFLATALNRQQPVGVLNLGIGGNCVVEGGLSQPALQRFDRDILGQHHATRLILFEGTNDIGLCPKGQSEQVVDRLISAYVQLIDKAHAAGMTVYLATITPFKGNGWYTPFHEAARQEVNKWIRTSGKADVVIDFDRLVRDPANPDRLRPDYSDDWLHLNPTGYEAMGEYAASLLLNNL